MTVDVIMLSDAKTEELRLMTQHAISSIHASNPSIDFKIIVFEKQFGIANNGKLVNGYQGVTRDGVSISGYEGATTYLQTGEFNYNRYMNEGTRKGNSEWVIWANNDIVVEGDFMSEILRLSEKYSISSWCCNDGRINNWEDDHFQGYVIRKHINGWFIVARRIIWESIGGLDESHAFWYSDNAYADQLKQFNFRHAISTRTLVRHLHSKTLFTLPIEEQLIFTEGTIPT